MQLFALTVMRSHTNN